MVNESNDELNDVILVPKKQMAEYLLLNFFQNIPFVTWFMIDGRMNFLQ